MSGLRALAPHAQERSLALVFVFAHGGLVLLATCAPYDPGLLPQDTCGNGTVDADERCDIAIAAEKEGGCPTQCPEARGCDTYVLSGNGCKRQCETGTITTPRNGDGCCPNGYSASDDDDCDVCGDGIVGLHERCDPPDACPTAATCKSDTPCVSVALKGSPQSCTAYCQVTFIARCIGDDGCCPSECDHESDADCSPGCGDGKLDPMRGETCDPSVPTAPCTTDCNDGDACTMDSVLGSAANCNAACSHTAIEQPAEGDGCCPKDARPTADGDCTALFHPSLRHRYRFAGTGATVHDWFGSADGDAIGASLTGADSIELTGGTSGPYVDLPNGLISMRTDVTLEAWVTLHGPATDSFQRIFDFGNSTNGEDLQGLGTSFLYLSASSNSAGAPRLSFDGATTERVAVSGTAPLPREVPVHLAVTFAGAARVMTLYVDGAQVGNATATSGLSDIDDVNVWLGRSQYDQDEELHASFHEFRIYDQALSPSEIGASFTAGRDPAGR